LALFSPTGDPNSLIVHEYLWSGDEKAQQAWHRWTLPYPVADAYFAADRVVVLFVANDQVFGCELDVRQGDYTEDEFRKPFLDLYAFVDVVDNEVVIPPALVNFDPTLATKLKLSRAEGALAGEPVGFYTTEAPNVLRTVASYPDGRVA